MVILVTEMRKKADSARTSAKNLTRNDTLVLRPNENNPYLYQCLKSKVEYTNLIILTTPYRYITNLNDKIYYNNLLLYKKMHSETRKLDHVLNVNNILRKSSYDLGSFYIKKAGKRHIAVYLAKMTNRTTFHRE